MTPELLPIQGTRPERLAELAGIDLVDARRIFSLATRTGALPTRAPATVRRSALDAVRRLGEVPTLEIVERVESRSDPFVKYAFRLRDGAQIESVRIPLERAGRYCVCVSSQVGCALGCTFCATGRMGLERNLESWEIVEQVRILRDGLRGVGRVHGVVFQGMGEPLANVERVLEAVRVLSDPSGLAIDMRNITVCTAGLPSGVRTLLREVPAVRVALSLGTLRPGARRRLMPIDGVHPLESVLEACGEHARATRQSPLWAYTLLADENDGEHDAELLATLAKSFAQEFGVRPRISLIPYNEIRDIGAEAPAVSTSSRAEAPAMTKGPFARSDVNRLEAFAAVLRAAGVGCAVRYSGGGDVGAACGQLVRPRSPSTSTPRASRVALPFDVNRASSPLAAPEG